MAVAREKEEVFALLVVGSRTVTDYSFVRKKLEHLTSYIKSRYDILIVSGGAKGADTLAERYAVEKGYRFICFKPDWTNGKKAGYIRNRKMHEYVSRYAKRGCVVFWDGVSKGTTHSFDLAKEFGTPLRVIRKER